jgi:DNA repair protein RecO (recombination protein O)
MQWSDEGLILSVRAHGETAAVVELLTAQHGRALGLVHGGRSRRLRPVLQIGNQVDVTWKARLADQLGHMTLELRRGYAAEAMSDALQLAGLTCISTMSRLLPEREPHPSLYEVAMFVLSFIDDPTVWPALYARWELALLAELGFGLDLTTCAARGTNDNLVYVSPRSGRAVSESAGEPYKDRLLPLPAFLRDGRADGGIGTHDLTRALALTGYFLERRLLTPSGRTMPDARTRMIELLTRSTA